MYGKILKIFAVIASLGFAILGCETSDNSTNSKSTQSESSNLAPVVTAGSDQTISSSTTIKLKWSCQRSRFIAITRRSNFCQC